MNRPDSGGERLLGDFDRVLWWRAGNARPLLAWADPWSWIARRASALLRRVGISVRRRPVVNHRRPETEVAPVTTFSAAIDRRTLLLGSASLVALAACDAPGTDATAVRKGAGIAGISLLTAAIPETLNPLAGFGNTGMGKINEALLTLRGGPDDLPDLVPQLAAAPPEVSPDALTWTVRLRAGVTFSDGTPFTAQDVVATYRAVRDRATASPIAGDLVNLASVTAPDARTVVFVLSEPQVSFRTALLIGIAPARAIRAGQLVEDSVLNQQPIGTGPYLVEDYRTDRLVLVANPRYRNGPPELGRVTYVLAADDNTRAQRMSGGGFDGSVLPPRLAATFATGGGTRVVAATSADWRGLSLPSKNPVTADPVVRRALNLAVDRDALVQGVLAGFGRPAHTFVPPEYGEYHDPQAVFGHDLVAAGAMLDQAGWVRGGDGIRARAGLRAQFTLMYRPTDLLRRDLAAAFASAVLPLGFDVRLEGVEFAQAEPRIDQDALLLGGGDTPFDVDTQVYSCLHSSYPAAGAYYDNPGRYADQEMDAALDEGRTSLDPARRIAAYRRVQQLYVDDPSMVLLVFLDHTYVQTTAVESRWNRTPTMLEPHEHGTAWGPWARIEQWTRRA